MARNDRLYQLLAQLEHRDLLFLLEDGLGNTEKKYRKYTHQALADFVSLEIRKAAGNDFANFFRLQYEFPYKQILIDVANYLSDRHKSVLYQLSDNHSEEEIEKEILRLFERRTKQWMDRRKDPEKEQTEQQQAQGINADMVNRINRWAYIKHRIKKEMKDSVISKGIIAGMVAISSAGILEGSLLTSVGWRVIVNTVGPKAGLSLLGGIAGMSGASVVTLIGAATVGLGVFVPSTLYFYADTNYKKIIPTIIMLLSKIHLNMVFDGSGSPA